MMQNFVGALHVPSASQLGQCASNHLVGQEWSGCLERTHGKTMAFCRSVAFCQLRARPLCEAMVCDGAQRYPVVITELAAGPRPGCEQPGRVAGERLPTPSSSNARGARLAPSR